MKNAHLKEHKKHLERFKHPKWVLILLYKNIKYFKKHIDIKQQCVII